MISAPRSLQSREQLQKKGLTSKHTGEHNLSFFLILIDISLLGCSRSGYGSVHMHTGTQL